MNIRVDHRELIDIIKDMTKALPDCSHEPADPENCFICAGKLITRYDDMNHLTVLHEHQFEGGRYGNGKDNAKGRKRRRIKVAEAYK